MIKYLFPLYSMLLMINTLLANEKDWTEERINKAQNLAKNGKLEKFCEEFKKLSTEDQRKYANNWTTLELINGITKNPTTKEVETKPYYFANSINNNSNWGEAVLYPDNADLKKIRTTVPGEFNDLKLRYLTRIHYRCMPGADDRGAYIIIEKCETGPDYQGKGYAKTLLKGFLENFVVKQTVIKSVYSDLRAGATQHYFPEFGFKKGKNEAIAQKISGWKYMQNPYYLEIKPST